MSTSNSNPSIERVREVFRYDPDTGILYWKKKSGRKVRVGKVAGSPKPGGRNRYLHLSLDKKFLLVHRIAWAIVYGYWPDEIDHQNGDGLDNRLENLRDVPRAENGKNTRRPLHNTSGVIGVTWDAKRQKWKPQIKVNRKNINLGRFSKLEDAILVRKQAEVELGFHKNHGR